MQSVLTSRTATPAFSCQCEVLNSIGLFDDLGARSRAERKQRTMPSFLVAKDVVKSYGGGAAKTWAVRGASLELEAGGFCAIVGPSGCGKTTLLSLFGALDRPDSG